MIGRRRAAAIRFVNEEESAMGGFTPVWVIGCMSGTSMDGVDAAAVLTDGESVFEFGRTSYRPYTESERNAIDAAKGTWQCDPKAATAASVVVAAHAEVLAGFKGDMAVGFHGQTLAHDPSTGRTHQAGSGKALAEASGRRVIWDFRSADLAHSGQGAPLAPFFHFAMAKMLERKNPFVFLNLGGVSNVTWCDARKDEVLCEGAVMAFDTGPANSLIDDLVYRREGLRFDNDGAISASGTASREVVRQFDCESYFGIRPPKSLDRDKFTSLGAKVAGMTLGDAAATLAACAAHAVRRGFEHFPIMPDGVAVCGGGRRNAALMAELADRLPVPVRTVEDYGLQGDMIEAQAFALLAVRVLRGLPTSCPATTGCRLPVCGGKESVPN